MMLTSEGILMQKHRRLTFSILLTALFLAGCRPASPAEEAMPSASFETNNDALTDQETIVILHTNDVHCGINDAIGYDGLMLYKKELLESYDHVLLVDAGDAIQGGPYGTVSKGKAIIDLMNRCGYDAAALGNHEFDYGFEALDDLSEELNCGYICANFCTADGEPVFEPYKIIEAGQRSVAFISVVTPETFTKTAIHSIVDDAGIPMYDFLADETGERLGACVQKYTDEARAKGADSVILLSHIGEETPDNRTFTTERILSYVNGVDAVIDAHTHYAYNNTVKDKTGKEIPVIQTGTKLTSIGRIDIAGDGTLHTELIDEVPEPADLPFETAARRRTERRVDPEMSKAIQEIMDSYAGVMERKIGETSFDLSIQSEEKGRLSKKEETGIGDLIADAYRHYAECDIAVANGGSVREGIPAGDITFKTILSVIPFSNDIITVKIKGQDLLDALEFGSRALPQESAGFLLPSGLTYTIDLTMQSAALSDEAGNFDHIEGEYRVKDVMINGKPLDLQAEYTFATDNFLLGGGDGMTMLKNCEIIRYTGYCSNELLADYIETVLGKEIPERYSKPQGRIQIIN